VLEVATDHVPLVGERPIRPVEEERAERRVRDRAGEGETDRRECDHAEDEARAQ
jgi:hypothetical protein